MDKKSFERLQVYQLAERLADDLWIIIIEWDLFAPILSVNNSFVQPTVLAQILLKAQAKEAFKTTAVS